MDVSPEGCGEPRVTSERVYSLWVSCANVQRNTRARKVSISEAFMHLPPASSFAGIYRAPRAGSAIATGSSFCLEKLYRCRQGETHGDHFTTSPMANMEGNMDEAVPSAEGHGERWSSSYTIGHLALRSFISPISWQAVYGILLYYQIKLLIQSLRSFHFQFVLT